MKKLRFRSLSISYLLYCGIAFFCFSCVSDKDFLNNPNQPIPDQIDYNYYVQMVQLELPNFANEVSVFARQLTRMESYNYADYAANGITAEAMNKAWRSAYYGLLINIKKGRETAVLAQKYNHQAILNIIEAYTLMVMVDVWGDVPYSEALTGINANPKLDKGSEVYEVALQKLNESINLFNPSVEYPTQDLYFTTGTTATKISRWKKIINSLKLRWFLQTHLVNLHAKDSINAVLASPLGLISSYEEDFQFRYGKNSSSPDSRHPLYAKSYIVGGPSASVDGGSLYFTPYSMNLISSWGDPRWRFLIQRQADVSLANTGNYRCKGSAKPSFFLLTDLFCQVGTFWTKDHGNNDAPPADGNLRTGYGLYPVGGRFDNGYNLITAGGGDGGNGIFPLLTSSMVKFYRLEAALTLSTQDLGNEQSLFMEGMKDFNTKLLNFSSNFDTTTAIYKNGYMVEFGTFVTNRTDSFLKSSTPVKLKLAMEEFYKADWGNGIAAYNNYRRTGLPDDMQPLRSVPPGTYNFIHSLPYPAEARDLNQNITAKDVYSYPKVFWAQTTSFSLR